MASVPRWIDDELKERLSQYRLDRKSVLPTIHGGPRHRLANGAGGNAEGTTGKAGETLNDAKTLDDAKVEVDEKAGFTNKVDMRTLGLIRKQLWQLQC
ncbi:hypothetical protein PG988_006567 [Apiospora saccharicola]